VRVRWRLRCRPPHCNAWQRGRRHRHAGIGHRIDVCHRASVGHRIGLCHRADGRNDRAGIH